MMSIGRSSRRENLLRVTGIEPSFLIRTRLANHIRASSREERLHQQARHMTAPDRNRRHAKKCLTARRRHMSTLVFQRPRPDELEVRPRDEIPPAVILIEFDMIGDHGSAQFQVTSATA